MIGSSFEQVLMELPVSALSLDWLWILAFLQDILDNELGEGVDLAKDGGGQVVLSSNAFLLLLFIHFSFELVYLLQWNLMSLLCNNFEIRKDAI